MDLSKLSLGRYSPEPTRYELDTIAKPVDVRAIEAKRMLDRVISSADVDSEIDELAAVETYTDPAGPFATPALPEDFRPAIVDNKLLSGAYVARTDGDPRSPRRLIVSILRFPDNGAAQAAVDQMAAKVRETSPLSVEIDGQPEVFAFTKDWTAATVLAARGAYTLILNYGLESPDENQVSAGLTTAVGLQLARMQHSPPTPWEEVLDVPLDPDGIMQRALPSDRSHRYSPELDFGAHTPEGQLHYERNPAQMGKAFRDSGTDLIGRRAGIVYRTRDLEGSFTLQNALATLGKRDESIPPPPYIADARCVRLYESDPVRKTNLMCAVVRGRFVGVVFATSGVTGSVNPELYERAAAQYTLLENDR